MEMKAGWKSREGREKEEEEGDGEEVDGGDVDDDVLTGLSDAGRNRISSGSTSRRRATNFR